MMRSKKYFDLKDVCEKILMLSRPRFWFYLLGPFIIGISAGRELQVLFNPMTWYGFFYFLFPANLFIYGVNDYFDRALDIANPKKRKQERYMLAKDATLYVWITVISVLLSIPLFFVSPLITGLMVLFLLAGLFYSSPPLRFKTKILFDSLSNFFYILPGVIGYVLVAGQLPSFDILIAGSLWAVAMHLFSAAVDIESDIAAGIKTTATTLGFERSLLLTSALWFTSGLLVKEYSVLMLLGLLYPLFPILVLMKKIDITFIYWLFPWINTIFGFILFCVVTT